MQGFSVKESPFFVINGVTLFMIFNLLFVYKLFIIPANINARELIDVGGLLMIFLAVYAQTGLFFLFFVPSGAFLFTGGVLIATGNLQYNLLTVIVLMVTAAVLGCFTGYWIGYKAGPILYAKKDTRFFKHAHLISAENFYTKYRHWALTAGLLLPVIRTFSPIVAGIIKLDLLKFFIMVFIGSLFYILLYLVAGYLIGRIPALQNYLPYIITAIIIIVTIPAVIKIIKEFKKA